MLMMARLQLVALLASGTAAVSLRDWMISTGMNTSYLENALVQSASEGVHSVDDMFQMDGPRLDAIFGRGLAARFERKLNERASEQSIQRKILEKDEIALFLHTLFGPDGRSWYMDWKMITGLVLLASLLVFASQNREVVVHAKHTNASNGRALLLIAAMNLLTLALAQHIESAEQLNCFLLLLHGLILIFGGALILSFIEEAGDGSTKYTVSSVYSNFSRPGSEVIFATLAQGCLVGLYAIQACRISADMCYFYWFISIVTVQIWMISSLPQTMGPFFFDSIPMWRELLRHPVTAVVFEQEVVLVSRPRLLLHTLLGALFNGYAFLYIMATVPLVLAQSASPLEYVLNSFALTFICSLDDLDPVEFSVQDGASFEPMSGLPSLLSRLNSKPLSSTELNDAHLLQGRTSD
eukprot:TRINITY_DN9013_c0_g1_i2.p1 TRINITY_DN9013_c0_g1~~TRINITY_DN9013_c0_g1_i2.p1  ORF type:complete len:410 (+),score=43.85 TRINITY_DN9013_c0_g1_i2:23-1252(+)